MIDFCDMYTRNKNLNVIKMKYKAIRTPIYVKIGLGVIYGIWRTYLHRISFEINREYSTRSTTQHLGMFGKLGCPNQKKVCVTKPLESCARAHYATQASLFYLMSLESRTSTHSLSKLVTRRIGPERWLVLSNADTVPLSASHLLEKIK